MVMLSAGVLRSAMVAGVLLAVASLPAAADESAREALAGERRDIVNRLESYGAQREKAEGARTRADQAIQFSRELKDAQAQAIAQRALVNAEAALAQLSRLASADRQRLGHLNKRMNQLIEAGRIDYVSRFQGAVSRTGDKDLDAPLEAGDTITTGANGYFEITYPGGSTTTVGPNTTLRILGEDETAYYQLRGKMHYVLRCLKSRDYCRYRRVVANSSIGVRGTEFETIAAGDGSATIRVFEGKVTVTPEVEGADAFDVTAGHQAKVANDGRIIDQSPLDQARVTAWWNF